MYYLIFSYVLFVLIQWTSGKLHPLVIGGEEFRPHVHKHLVQLVMYFDDNIIVGRCSGSILSERWIISAAHCLDINSLKVNVKKIGHEKNIANAFEYTVFQKYIDEYTDVLTSMENDLALIKTARNILFDDNTQPIRLSETRPVLGQGVIVAGYGISEYGNSIPREGSTFITKCSGPGTTLLCTNSTVKAWFGDSGGSLVSKGTLVGVISGKQENCNNGTDGLCESFYVDVSQHLNWIKSVTGIRLN